MPGKAHTPEQIINRLREAEVELAQGATIGGACRKLAITECPGPGRSAVYPAWRRASCRVLCQAAKAIPPT